MTNEKNFFDLVIAFCHWVKRCAKGLVDCIARTIRLSLQQWWAVLIGIALCVAVGLWHSSANRRVFHGDAVMLFAPEARQNIISQIDYIGSLCHSPQMKDKLSLDADYANTIHKIKHYNIIDFKNDSVPDIIEYKKIGSFLADTFNVVMNDRLDIRIYMKHETDFQTVCQALQHYLATQPDIARIDSIRKANLRRYIEFCDEEIARIDSLSNYEYFIRNQQLDLQFKQTLVMSERDQELYYTDRETLLRQREKAENILYCNPNVVDFVAPMSALTFPRTWEMTIWIVVGYLFGLCLALLAKYRKEIGTYLKQR
ncbi:MAG: hypothetical protein Q4D14_03685 [Bacteroidales bacterium]|nr:hypothetical protein [Bacteroidales bacterium]